MTAFLSRPAKAGYTLIELIVAVGLFALVMTLAAGAYLIMIGVNRETQALSTGINNLSFVLETVTRSIRSGTSYAQTDSSSFRFIDQNGQHVSYGLVGNAIAVCSNPTDYCLPNAILTEPSVTISSLTFSLSGAQPESKGDLYQPYVTIYIAGSVSTGPGKTQTFNVESSAAMRGTDL